jgi:RNase H-fold protein (predicted Holliday junction resolvase)
MADTLGEELSEALTNITALIVATESKQQRRRLTKIQSEIAGQLQVFIDNVVDERLPEYIAATKALSQANQKAKAAKEDLDRLAQAIRQFALAIDTVVELAEIVAPV